MLAPQLFTSEELNGTKPLSRRNAMVKGITTIATGIVAANAAPKVARTSSFEKPSTEEGSPLQMAKILRRLGDEIREKKAPPEALSAWLKFNAGIYYKEREGLVLTAANLKHYIYGAGTPLDITNRYVENISKPPFYRDFKTPYRGPSYLNSNIGSLLTIRDNIHKNNLGRQNEVEAFPLTVTGNPNNHYQANDNIQIQGVVGGSVAFGAAEFPDISTSLGRYTLTATGKIVYYSVQYRDDLYNLTNEGDVPEFSPAVLSSIGYTVGMMQIENSHINIYDIYDFEKTPDHRAYNGGPSLMTTLDFFGEQAFGMRYNAWKQSTLEKNRPLVEQMYDTRVFDFDYGTDGPMLQELGYAHPYQINADFDIPNETLKVLVPPETISYSAF